MLVRGGLGVARCFLTEGELVWKGMHAAPGTGEVSTAQEGATILGSASVSLVSSRHSGLGPITGGGGGDWFKP